jgi:hypothetical protein
MKLLFLSATVLERGFIVMFGAHEVIYGRKVNDVHKTCARRM